jgi:hypothetical protein
MKMTNMKWLIVGAPIALVVLLAGGVRLTSLLPFAFVLVCPIMMMFMMKGMHGEHGGTNDAPSKNSTRYLAK